MRPVVVAALALAATGLATPARAYRRAEVDGVPGRYLYWPVRTLSYAINRSACPDVPLNEAVGAVKRAFFAWASPSCTDVYFNYEGLVTTTDTSLALREGQSPDDRNLLIWRSSWPPPGGEGGLSHDMAAVTTLIYSTETGVILDADIDLNSEDFFWTTTDDTTKVATDIQHVVAHEAGHLLGLTHSQEPAATMYESTSQGEIDKRDLHEDDELGVCTIYPFGATTPKGKGQGEVPQQVEGGCRVAAGRHPGPGGAASGLVLVVLVLVRWRGPWRAPRDAKPPA